MCSPWPLFENSTFYVLPEEHFFFCFSLVMNYCFISLNSTLKKYIHFIVIPQDFASNIMYFIQFMQFEGFFGGWWRFLLTATFNPDRIRSIVMVCANFEHRFNLLSARFHQHDCITEYISFANAINGLLMGHSDCSPAIENILGHVDCVYTGNFSYSPFSGSFSSIILFFILFVGCRFDKMHCSIVLVVGQKSNSDSGK